MGRKKRAASRSKKASTSSKPASGGGGWEPAFQYKCSKCPAICGSDFELTRCPMGRCDGELTRFGKGSRGKRSAA